MKLCIDWKAVCQDWKTSGLSKNGSVSIFVSRVVFKGVDKGLYLEVRNTGWKYY